MFGRRADGTLARGLSNERRVMPYIMRGRNESAVYARHEIGLVKTDAFIREWNQLNPMLRIDVFHIALWAMRATFEQQPGCHRFVAGGRLYDRTGIWFSYAVKRKLETGAPMVVVKRRFDTDASFAAMVEGMQVAQGDAVSPTRSTVDKELGLLFVFPGFVRRIIFAAIRGADRLGLLPRSFIEKDPMFASAFFANMASLGMPAVYHHLYEYGTVGVFSSLGRPVTDPTSPTSGPDRRRSMEVKWTFDERSDDGLASWYSMRRFKAVMEDPEASGIRLEAVAAGAAAIDGAPDGSESDRVGEVVAPVES
jgi:hypothetical protein